MGGLSICGACLTASEAVTDRQSPPERGFCRFCDHKKGPRPKSGASNLLTGWRGGAHAGSASDSGCDHTTPLKDYNGHVLAARLPPSQALQVARITTAACL